MSPLATIVGSGRMRVGQPESPCADFDAYPLTTAGFHPPNLQGPTEIASGSIAYYLRPGIVTNTVPGDRPDGGFHFGIYNSGGGDLGGAFASNRLHLLVVGAGTLILHSNAGLFGFDWYVAHTLDIFIPHDIDSAVNHPSGTDLAVPIPDDGNCIHWLNTSMDGWTYTGATWVPAEVGELVVPRLSLRGSGVVGGSV